MKKRKMMALFAVALASMMTVEVAAQTSGIEIGNAVEDSSISVIDETEDEQAVSADGLTVSADGMTAEMVYTESGDPSVAKMSKTTIANTYKAIYNAKYPYYVTNPSVRAPFSMGELNGQHQQYGLDSVNLMRQIGGLKPVQLRSDYIVYAQSGAVLLASSSFSHTPSCPSDMDPSFYENGYTGTSRGNIAWASGGTNTLANFTISYMKDNSGANVKMVGHRRWILNPTMAYTGLGHATAQNGALYSVMYAFDRSAATPDYDFISWPASGNFPTQLINAGDPWSVTLNPAKFTVGSGQLNTSSVTVSITAPNGKTKTFSAADTTTDVNDKTKPYFRIDTAGYGVGNCIIFRPGTNTFGSGNLSGTYTVMITGVKDTMGVPATICYTVDFFNIDEYANNNSKNPVDEAAVGNFVKRLYSKCFGREADESGLMYWKDKLMSGKMSGAAVAQGFFFSDEFKNRNVSDDVFVETLYNVMMDRASDAGGKSDWLYKLQNGVTREGVFKGFCDSAEFTNVCKTYGVTRGTIAVAQQRDVNPGLTTFVARLYTKALGRQYETAGLNTWCGRINRKEWKLDDVATTGFFHSPEFVNKKLNNSDYVKTLYQTFFDREYDQSGYDYWMAKLARGTSRDEVLRGFSRSAEFANLKKTYGL